MNAPMSHLDSEAALSHKKCDIALGTVTPPAK
jgi:hypothetical protein